MFSKKRSKHRETKIQMKDNKTKFQLRKLKTSINNKDLNNSSIDPKDQKTLPKKKLSKNQK